MKPVRCVHFLLAIALLIILPARIPVAAQGDGQIQWEKYKPVPVALPSPTDSTPSFYKRKSEWKKIIDEYWGPGAPLAEKQRIFNQYADYIQRYFTAFEGLGISWDSLRSHYYSQINDSTSHGRFSALLSYMAYALRELHTSVLDFALMEGFAQGETSGINEPRRGKPIWIMTELLNARHFGAVLTPLADSSAVVIRAIQNHPLNLQPGDVVLGYEGVPWRQIARELLAAEVPTTNLYGGSRSMEMHRLLASAGFNWHLFDTIDIVKYGTGDTLHLPVDSLASIVMTDTLYNNECLEVPGVSWPDWWWNYNIRPNREPVTSGIVAGTNIGYIYVSAQTYHADGDLSPDSEERFSQAIADFWNTDGLIIDLRGDHGGRVNANFNSAFSRIINFDTHTLDYYWREGSGNLTALTPYPYLPSRPMAIDADEESVYDRPIAVLVGPGCMSMGDITAYRLTYFPNVRFFGKPTSMGWGGGGEPWPGFDRPHVDGYILGGSEIMLRDHYQPDRDLERIEFPVDEEVWLTRDDVARGEDTVVKRALAWIQSVAHARDVTTQTRGFSGGTERVELTGLIRNPGGRPLDVTAYFRVDTTIVDSATFFDDGLHSDGAQGDGIWGAYWNVPAGEEFYNVLLSVRDPGDPTTYAMPYLARFTTAGPVVARDTIEAEVPFANYRTINVWLKNAGQTRTIPSITGRIGTEESLVVSFIEVEKGFGNIAPGDSLKQRYVANVDPGIGTFTCTVDIKSGGFGYWGKPVVVTGVEKEIAPVPSTYALGQNYPNPFNPTTVIRYQLPVVSYVKLVVYDLLGREVRVLVDEKKETGYHEVRFDGSGLSSGVYLYRLQAGDFIQIRKLLLVK